MKNNENKIEIEPVIETKEDCDKYIYNIPYFAFLDILGFKALVKNNSHNTLIELYKKLVSFPVTFYNDFHSNEQKQLEEKLGEKFYPTGLRLVNISDSIMLWTSNCREKTLIELLFAVKLLMSTAIKTGIPLRGTVVMGSIEVLEQQGSLSIVGRGLVHAYSTEKMQEWSGCIIDKGIFRFLRSLNKVVLQKDTPLRVEKLNNLIIETNVPLKNGKVVKSYVINWVNKMELTENDIYNSFAKFNKRDKEDKKQKNEVERKIANTISFYKSVQSL